MMLTATRDSGASCLWISAQNGHLEVLKALLEVGGRELVILTMDNGVSQLPLHQCAVGASGCAESAAGGRGARSAAADQGRWSLLSFCRTSCKPRGGLQGTGDGVPDRRPVFARDHDPQAWVNLQPLGTQVRKKRGHLLSHRGCRCGCVTRHGETDVRQLGGAAGDWHPASSAEG